MNNKKLQILSKSVLGRALSILGFFKGYDPLPPAYVALYLTYRCDLNCPFCYQDKSKITTFPDMTLEDAIIIENNIRKSLWFKPRVHFFGGEPTISASFLPIFKLFAGKGYSLSLTSNGHVGKYAQEILNTAGRVEINLSLNTMDFGKTHSVLEMFARDSGKKNVRINLNCPINRDNCGRLSEVVDEFKESHVESFVFQHPAFSQQYNIGLDPATIEKQVGEIGKRKYKFPVLFNPRIRARDIKSYYAEGPFPVSASKCFYSWVVLLIQPNGDIAPCEMISAALGNMKNASLKELWNSKEFVTFRKSLLERGADRPPCSRCCHKRYP